MKWFPWTWLVRRAARSYGIIDPVTVAARLRKFAEPSEVDAPLELLRAGTVLQARGIVNTRAIQHNLDWVWPYWVERQFNPRDPSFIPRAFSFSHINLTHRNWTALMLPDCDHYGLVDPRGLVTPLHDGWSLDTWILGEDFYLLPSRAQDVRQYVSCKNGDWRVTTVCEDHDVELMTTASLQWKHDVPTVTLHIEVTPSRPVDLVVALRPYNPEGIQFVDRVDVTSDPTGWRVNGNQPVTFSTTPDRYQLSTYAEGDVLHQSASSTPETTITCPVGMATAAARFQLPARTTYDLDIDIPISTPGRTSNHSTDQHRRRTTWSDIDGSVPTLDIPDTHIQQLYTHATRSLYGLTAGQPVPGPYTYRRFWYRDACLMLNAMLSINNKEATRRALEVTFPRYQTRKGFYRSQDGEWDSNGQVLWLAGQYAAHMGEPFPDATLNHLRQGAKWILNKRIIDATSPYYGMLPAGFSAEHLGTNNHYYWDNFWAIAGLRAAQGIFSRAGDITFSDRVRDAAENLERTVQESIQSIPRDRAHGGIPAAPNRRMDAGAIGSIVSDYPLQLTPPAAPQVMQTVEFLLEHCQIDHGFYHDMTHSGINPYLTLHLAQVLLRAGDRRYLDLIKRVAELASSTGQWPEAIHPQTGCGCMGDGHHGWASAEWVLMIRHLFVREEQQRLVIGSGLFPEWLSDDVHLAFGPTATTHGAVSVEIDIRNGLPHVTILGGRDLTPSAITLALPTTADCTCTVNGVDVHATPRSGEPS